MKFIHFKTLGLCLAFGGALLASATLSAQAAEVHKIDQIMDLRALSPEDLYKFEPNYHWIEPGDSIRFLNSTGNHTVKSIPGIWPQGVEPVDIAHQDIYDIKLTVPGVYGFRCKVHSRHGMYALIVVGSPASNLDEVELTNVNDRGRAVFKTLFIKLDKDRKARGR